MAYRDRTVPARNGVDVNEAADLAVVPGVAVGAGDVNAFATGGVESPIRLYRVYVDNR